MNKTLLHIDLSHNNLGKEDCELMETGLRHNHTLLGIHMIGNDMNTDAQGYFKNMGYDPAISHVLSRIAPNLTTGTVMKSLVELKATSNCWICEGWSQFLFKINPSEIITL